MTRHGMAIGGDGHMVDVASSGRPVHPQGERGQRSVNRRHGFAGERVADVANDCRGCNFRPASDAVQPAGRLRQVIHMYCVQICSSTSKLQVLFAREGGDFVLL